MSALYQRIDAGLREELREAIGRHRWRLWFRDTVVTSVDEDSVTLAVPTEVHRTWLTFTYGDLLQETCDRLLGHGVRIRLEVSPDQQRKRELRDLLPDRQDAWERLIARHRQPATLDAFVTSGPGRFAVMLLAALRDGHGALPALFLYGPLGCGKTFLLDGLARECAQQGPGEVLRLSAQDFTTRYVGALRRGELGALRAFRDDLRARRLVILDGIDELVHRPATQQELARFLEEARGSRTHVVTAGREHPQQIPGLSERLRSLLQAGAVVRLPLPTGAMLDDVLRARAKAHGSALPDDVCEAIVARTGSVRGAVALAERWAAASTELGTPLGVDWLTELAPGAAATASEEVVRRVKDLVASHYGVDVADLGRPTKARHAAMPRRVAMYLVYRACALPLAGLAKAFGLRSHSSVSRAIREVRALRETQPAMEQTLEGLLAQV